MHLISLIIIFIFTALGTVLGNDEQSNGTVEVKDPLIYQRLRFDEDFLQIYRRFQRHLRVDEEKRSVKFNTTLLSDDDRPRTVRLEYFTNKQVESSSITQNDLIFEALDRTYLTRLVPVYIFNYDQRADLAKASDPKLVSKKKCLRDLGFLTSQVKSLDWARFGAVDEIRMSSSGASPELMAMFESSGSEEPGLLLGNYHWTGNWRECTKRRIFSLGQTAGQANQSEVPVEFKGRYCIVSIRSPSWDKKIEQRVEELEQRGYFKYQEQRVDYARFFRIQLGVCLPDSCDSRAIEWDPMAVRAWGLAKLSGPLRSYSMADLYCLPDETSELRKLKPSGWLFLAFLGAWCSLIALSTLHDLLVPPEKSPTTLFAKLVNSTSLVQNIQRLLETQSCRLPPAESTSSQSSTKQSARAPQTTKRLHQNDLLFLNSIKVVTMPMIIFGHVGMLLKHLDRFALDYDGLDSRLVFHFQASTPFFVDWYFVITGFLTTYIVFVTRKVERNSLLQWLYSIFHRYWRLAPLYILLFWFSKSVFMFTSSGPLWDYGSSNMTLRAICGRESWIFPLTLTSNLHPIHEECIMPTWYIACDFQFYLVTPLLFVLLHKSPLMGWLASIGAIGACISLRLHRYLTDRRAQPLELMRPRYDLYMRNNWDMHPTYVYPQYRIATYLIGILAGHYTYMVLSGKWTSKMYPSTVATSQESSKQTGRKSHSQATSRPVAQRFPAILRTLAWLFGVQQLVSMMFATWLISDMFPVALEKYVKYFTAIVYAVSHTVVGLAIALVLVTFMLGQFPRLKLWMSHPIWTVLSRVNFIVYLTQVEWINWLIQSDHRVVETSSLEMVKIFFYLCCIVYAFSTICTVLFELPFAHLERNFVGSLLMGTNRPKESEATGIALQRSGCESQNRVSSGNEMSPLVEQLESARKHCPKCKCQTNGGGK